MMNKLEKLPKVELHLHLDGSISLKLASKLSGMEEEDVKKKMIAPDKCQNLSDYLTKFDFPISLMQTRENLMMVAEDLVHQLERDGVIYAEVRFAPMFHTKEGLSMEDVVLAVIDGLHQNKNVQSNLILCMMRGASLEDNLKTIDLAEKYLNRGVVAIDLAGAEDRYPIDAYLDLLKKARQKNIPITVHAGENGSSEEVRKAILAGALRIGHGIHAILDKEVLQLIKEKNILLEICPTSNVQTNAIDLFSNHPVLKFYEAGIAISINTDNRTVSNVSLTREYLKLDQYFSFSIDDYLKMNKMAIEHSFLLMDEKNKLLKKLENDFSKIDI